eukprot:1117640-Pelagomonas_calceolata.AAC.15
MAVPLAFLWWQKLNDHTAKYAFSGRKVQKAQGEGVTYYVAVPACGGSLGLHGGGLAYSPRLWLINGYNGG